MREKFFFFLVDFVIEDLSTNTSYFWSVPIW